jgi:putative transposase
MFFLQISIKYIKPNAEILSYCLMPNHFHFLLFMNKHGCAPSIQTKIGFNANQNNDFNYQQQFSKNLSIMLRSYARAINNQNNQSGSLFRSKTKAKQTYNDPIINNYFGNGIKNQSYEQTCFEYIHQNPVKAGLVKRDTDWLFSSAREYAGETKNGICNIELSKALGILY